MEIIVEGNASSSYSPERVVIELTFEAKSKDYEKVVELGTKSVLDFMESLTKHTKLTKDDMKTLSFKVREVFKQVKKEKGNKTEWKTEFENVFDCFEFTQRATLEFDYSLEIMSKIIALVTKLKQPPYYTVYFDIKDKEARKNDILAKSCKKANERALAIAKSLGYKTVKCTKTDFEPIYADLRSKSNLNSKDMYARSASMAMCLQEDNEQIQQAIEKTFTPEDIVINQNIYCLFIAE